MADNYNIDELLAELRAKRTAIENKTAAPAAQPTEEQPAEKPAVWKAPRFAAVNPTVLPQLDTLPADSAERWQ